MAAKKKKRGWVALIIILVLLALPPAALYLYTKTCAFDVDAVRSKQTAAEQIADTAIDDGSVSVFYSPARVYELISTDDINGSLEGMLHGAVRLDTFAVEPADDRTAVYARVTLMGFLPLTLRAEADITAQNSLIGVWIDSLELGTKFSVPIEKIGLSRSFTLSPSAPVDGLTVSPDGFTVSYRFLQEHFLADLMPDTELQQTYARFCPEGAADDPLFRLWDGNASLSGNTVRSAVKDRDGLCGILALASASSAENFLRTLSEFESETLFPGAKEAIAAKKELYRTEAADAYRALTKDVDIFVSYAADKRFYISDEAVMLRAKRVNDSTPVDPAEAMTDCPLLSPAESRYVLIYWENAPVPPASGDGQTLGSLEAKELLKKGVLLLNRRSHYAPALVTRFAGVLPCLLYRGANGETVITELSEETYTALIEKAGLLLLDTYQADAGIPYDAPSDTGDQSGYRIISLPREQ